MNKFLNAIRNLNDDSLIRFLVYCSMYGSIPLSIVANWRIGDEDNFERVVDVVKKNIELSYEREVGKDETN